MENKGEHAPVLTSMHLREWDMIRTQMTTLTEGRTDGQGKAEMKGRGHSKERKILNKQTFGGKFSLRLF